MDRTHRPVARVGIAAGLLTLATAAPALANSPTTAYALGTSHAVGKNWAVRVISSVYDANAEMAAANMFNDPPARGTHYVLVDIAARKVSSGRGNAAWDLDSRLYGAATHSLYEPCEEVAPQQLMDANDVYRGGVDSGDLCFQVKNSDISHGGLMLHVEDSLSFTNTATWFRTR